MMDKSDWTLVETAQDIEILMVAFGGFHDGCIREMRLIDNGYVTPDFGVGMVEAAKLRIVFQRQWDKPSAIELEFTRLFHLNVPGLPENYFPDISEAALFIRDDKIYWAKTYDWKPETNDNSVAWVSAKSLRWRKLKNALGAAPFYRSPFDTDDS